MSTIREVADRPGVSATTVSHVLNQTRFVSAPIRGRVLQAMHELGYRPNALARSLRRGETKTLGLVLPDSANPFFAELGREIEFAAFRLLQRDPLQHGGRPGQGAPLHGRAGDEAGPRLLLIATGDRPESVEAVLRRKLPVVIVDSERPDVEAEAVMVDTRQGSRDATQHLIGLGHRRVGCIVGPSHPTPSSQRLAGYMDALAEAGLAFDPRLTRRLSPGVRLDRHARAPSRGRSPHRDLRRQRPHGHRRPASRRRGRPPGAHDRAVVGFGDIELASYTTPPLTTVGQPVGAMGRAAIELLAGHIADRDRPPVRGVLAARLVVRASCGDPDGPGLPVEATISSGH